MPSVDAARGSGNPRWFPGGSPMVFSIPRERDITLAVPMGEFTALLIQFL